MTQPSSLPTMTPVPRQSRWLSALVQPVYRIFDWFYTSNLNPLYRSGTLAVGLLFILLVTGLYLSFFYSVSDPHASVVEIQEQVWFGRWIRAMHRYATVGGVFAIILHVIQLLAQGKTWGPRTLAWLSGIILTLMFLLSAWSGYVMVWDLHGQRVAIAGARVLSLAPVLHDVVTAAFNGTAPVPPGFFFMNLFLHVALPLAMILFLWIHTAKLARAVWFPRRSIMLGTTLCLITAGVLWPVPLLSKADLLRVVGRIPTDMSTGFWMAWIEWTGVFPTAGLLFLGVVFLSVIPWWWRPTRGSERSLSRVDIERCTGCMQCVRDCPYDAIHMTPRADGKRLVAEIIPSNCVSCGICAASCADLAIGPPGRDGVAQMERVREFCAERTAGMRENELTLIACMNNGHLLDSLRASLADEKGVAVYPVECCGCVHSDVLESILGVSRCVGLIGCPGRNCFNRDGGDLLSERVYEKRVPFLDRAIDRGRILVTSCSDAELSELHSRLQQFRAHNGASVLVSSGMNRWMLTVRTLVTTALLLVGTVALAVLPNGRDPHFALIRIAGSLPSATAEQCRPPSKEEIGEAPLHMQPKEVCVRLPLQYTVDLSVDGEMVAQETVSDRGGRVDRPLWLNIERRVTPGDRSVRVQVLRREAEPLVCAVQSTLSAGQILLVRFDSAKNALYCGE